MAKNNAAFAKLLFLEHSTYLCQQPRKHGFRGCFASGFSERTRWVSKYLFLGMIQNPLLDPQTVASFGLLRVGL